jgi:hypothetical protein
VVRVFASSDTPAERKPALLRFGPPRPAGKPKATVAPKPERVKQENDPCLVTTARGSGDW